MTCFLSIFLIRNYYFNFGPKIIQQYKKLKSASKSASTALDATSNNSKSSLVPLTLLFL